jgi:tRNA (uracil-5-)-methyltransferase TRM9
VRPETFERLRALNHEFYQTFAEYFADKRARLQPGVVHALEHYPPSGPALDLGCGHGALAERLVSEGPTHTYLGVDLSEGMITLARSAVPDPRVRFLRADLSQPAWLEALQTVPKEFQPPYTTVYSFAFLHHIPGERRREQVVQEVSNLMQPGGLWILSVWDFMRSNRLRKRILPWESVGVDPDDVEEGDYLIDWRHGGQGTRYVHHFSIEALEMLAQQGGLEVVETYSMDGENGLLGLYQVLKKA